MIKSFKSYTSFILQEETDTKTGNYISVGCQLPTLDDIKFISGKATKDAHITIMYSKDTSVEPKEILLYMNDHIKNHGVGVITAAKLYGEEDAALVLELDAPKLHSIHHHLAGLFQLKHSYDSYSPHVTIQYDMDKDEAEYWVNWINTRSELPGSFLFYNKFSSETIKEDWNE